MFFVPRACNLKAWWKLHEAFVVSCARKLRDRAAGIEFRTIQIIYSLPYARVSMSGARCGRVWNGRQREFPRERRLPSFFIISICCASFVQGKCV